MNRVVKRNGDLAPFDAQKIVNAIEAAMRETPAGVDHELAVKIAKDVHVLRGDLSVEEIQDIVEEKLMNSKRKDAARAYIRYRYLHKIARTQYDDLMRVVQEKLDASDVQNQNANVDERSFGGRAGEVANAVMSQFALDYLMSPLARSNHLNNRIYTHDLSSYAVGNHNCLSIPFDKLLAEGFNTRQTDIRPARSVSTAFQLIAVIFQIQSLQQFGGCSATHLDWTMVPYVRMSFSKHFKDGIKYTQMGDERIDMISDELSFNDKMANDPHCSRAYQYAMDMTKKEVKQAVEGMFHNLNSLQSRSGNQLPFTSINFGTCTLPEGRMIIRALLEGSISGIGRLHRTSIFPCSIFQCMKGVNRKPGDPNYDLFLLALQSTAKRLYPNYANVDWSGNAGYDPKNPKTFFSTMGCRTANGWDINGFGQLKDGRGNICPVTIIMPTLAMEAKEKVEKEYAAGIIVNPFSFTEEYYIYAFMEILDQAIHDAKDILLERFEWICSQSPDGARFMYENGTMAGYDPKEGIRSALKHGTLAVGQIGLAETLQILIGENQTTSKGMELAKNIEKLFKDRCDEFKQKYKLNFGVYFTPEHNI